MLFKEKITPDWESIIADFLIENEFDPSRIQINCLTNKSDEIFSHSHLRQIGAIRGVPKQLKDGGVCLLFRFIESTYNNIIGKIPIVTIWSSKWGGTIHAQFSGFEYLKSLREDNIPSLSTEKINKNKEKAKRARERQEQSQRDKDNLLQQIKEEGSSVIDFYHRLNVPNPVPSRSREGDIITDSYASSDGCRRSSDIITDSLSVENKTRNKRINNEKNHQNDGLQIVVNSPNLVPSRDRDGNIIPDSYDLVGNKTRLDVQLNGDSRRLNGDNGDSTHEYFKRKKFPIDVARELGIVFSNRPDFKIVYDEDKKGELSILHINRPSDETIAYVPMYDMDGNVVNIQTIDAHGRKRFSSGYELLGNYFLIGEITEDTKTIGFSESLFTGYKLADLTQHPIVVCFTTSNLSSVLKNFSNVNTQKRNFVVYCDNDWVHDVEPETASYYSSQEYVSCLTQNLKVLERAKNGGLKKGVLAALQHGAQYCVPVFGNLVEYNPYSKMPNDFEDLLNIAGKDETLRQLADLRPLKYSECPKVSAKEGSEMLHSYIKEWGLSSDSMVIAATPSLGKTQACVDWICEKYVKNHDIHIRFLSPMQKNSRELEASIRKKNPNVKVVTMYGRGYEIDGQKMCAKADTIAKAARNGMPIYPSFCNGINGRCEHFKNCAYIEQYNHVHNANVILQPHAILTSNVGFLESKLPYPDAVIIDESFYNVFHGQFHLTAEQFLMPSNLDNEVVSNQVSSGIELFDCVRYTLLNCLCEEVNSLDMLREKFSIKYLEQVVNALPVGQKPKIDPSMSVADQEKILDDHKKSMGRWWHVRKILKLLIEESNPVNKSHFLHKVRMTHKDGVNIISVNYLKDSERLKPQGNKSALQIIDFLNQEKINNFNIDDLSLKGDVNIESGVKRLLQCGVLRREYVGYDEDDIFHLNFDLSTQYDESVKSLERPIKTLLIDADATKEITTRILPDIDFIYKQIDVELNADFHQIGTSNNSKRSIELSDHCGRLLNELAFEQLNKGEHILVIGYMSYIGNEERGIKANKNLQELIDQYPTQVHVGHFGSIRGIDKWKHIPTEYIMGRNLPPAFEVESIACAFWKIDEKPLKLSGKYNKRTIAIQMDSGIFYPVQNYVHDDPFIEEIKKQICEYETRQAALRIRLVHCEERKHVFLLSNQVIPGIHPKDIINAQNFLSRNTNIRDSRIEKVCEHFFNDKVPTIEELMTGFHGALPLNPELLYQTSNGVFPTPAAAKAWLQRMGLQGIGRSFINELLLTHPFAEKLANHHNAEWCMMEYRTAGQRRSSYILYLFKPGGSPKLNTVNSVAWMLENNLKQKIEIVESDINAENVTVDEDMQSLIKDLVAEQVENLKTIENDLCLHARYDCNDGKCDKCPNLNIKKLPVSVMFQNGQPIIKPAFEYRLE